MVSWRYPDTTKRVRVAFVCPTGSDPALSVVGTFCPITPDVMITQCSAAYFLAWVRRNFTLSTVYLLVQPSVRLQEAPFGSEQIFPRSSLQGKHFGQG